MLLSQQGAAWHEIGHWTRNSGSTEQQQQQQSRKSDPSDKLCESCLAFAHLAATAKSESPALVLADAGHVQSGAEDIASLAAAAPAPRSRGPPAAL